MRRPYQSRREFIRQYPPEVRKAAKYIASNLQMAERTVKLARIMRSEPRRAALENAAAAATQRAIGANEVLGMMEQPPGAETWIEAIQQRK